MPPAAPDQSASIPIDPNAILVNLILAFLAPMLLTVCGGSPGHARLAAAQTLESSRARTDCDLLLFAQVIAFGLAALSSLSISMTDGLFLHSAAPPGNFSRATSRPGSDQPTARAVNPWRVS